MVLLSNAFICYFWKIHEDTGSWTATTLCKQLVDPPKGTWLSLRYNILQMVDSSWFPVVQYLTTSSHTGYTWIMHIPYIYIYHLYTRNRQETCWARSTAWSAWRWCERFRPWSQQTDWRWLENSGLESGALPPNAVNMKTWSHTDSYGQYFSFKGPLIIRVSPGQPQLKLQHLHRRIQFVGTPSKPWEAFTTSVDCSV